MTLLQSVSVQRVARVWAIFIVLQYTLAVVSLLGYVALEPDFLQSSGEVISSDFSFVQVNATDYSPEVEVFGLTCRDQPRATVDCTANVRGKKLTQFLLALFLGVLGIARFAAGYIGCGIGQLITCGGCGIWWLVDFIVILTGQWCRNYDGCAWVNNM